VAFAGEGCQYGSAGTCRRMVSDVVGFFLVSALCSSNCEHRYSVLEVTCKGPRVLVRPFENDVHLQAVEKSPRGI
jgi:hypothetical protein